jgi:hypothetical protein
VAQLWFPVPVVDIRRITLFALDDGGDADEVCAYLFLTEPLQSRQSQAGQVCTADGPDDPQQVSTLVILPAG